MFEIRLGPWQVENSNDPEYESEVLLVEDTLTLAEIGIFARDKCLSELVDQENKPQEGANLSGYQLAEWFAWNWWRLRWEPYPDSPPIPRFLGASCLDWEQSHDIASIGSGWTWPNVTINPDGVNVILRAVSERRLEIAPLTYTSDEEVTVTAEAFESGVEDFVKRVLDRLDSRPLKDTALQSTWEDLESERKDPEVSFYRKLEACAGFDPDEAPKRLIDRLLAEVEKFGSEAVSEVALDDPDLLSGLQSLAQEYGTEIRSSDGALLSGSPEHCTLPWVEGVEAARALRSQEGLGFAISDKTLAELCGISPQFLKRRRGSSLSFVLENAIVLSPRSRQGRRFGAARLLGDRILTDFWQCENLRPATRTYTFRQKRQRAFAAEFLCPIDFLRDFLGGDFSEESRQDAAQHFGVSQDTATLQLINNGDLDRSQLPERR